MKDGQYAYAEARELEGDYMGAYTAFYDLADYNNARQQAGVCLEEQWQYALSLLSVDKAKADQAYADLKKRGIRFQKNDL